MLGTNDRDYWYCLDCNKLCRSYCDDSRLAGGLSKQLAWAIAAFSLHPAFLAFSTA